ncbi:MAG: hypothetical protein UX74_C0041G0003 [Parcubacteria group bacterium GW2011_GWA2_47_10b]|nr:MAG: hypothetical protein UX74_C0041G0003 [Parcubacteria group bacterium GW2011_GWA2_47_10b]
MTSLSINLDQFGFVQRERDTQGRVYKNRCGRDFLYYTLNYYLPDKFNAKVNNPEQITRRNLFGLKIPSFLAWTTLQFIYVPSLFARMGLSLEINNRRINTWFDLLKAIFSPSRLGWEQRIKEIERAVDNSQVSGINISLGLNGLLDHVIFVYSYDEENLYVFDTHQVAGLEYEKITQDDRYIMKLPKSVIKKRWSRFGRVWIVRRGLFV